MHELKPGQFGPPPPYGPVAAPYSGVKPRKRRRTLVIVLLVIVGLLTVCCGGAGLVGYRVVNRPWPQISGLEKPSGAVDRIATARVPAGTQHADAVTDGSTLYRMAGSGPSVRVEAQPLAAGGHRWSVDLPAATRLLGVRLTLLGDLLFVAVALADPDVDNQLYHVLRVADGGQASAERWQANSRRLDALFVGDHLISTVSDDDRRGGAVQRRDQRTGATVWTRRLTGRPTEVVAPTVWPGTGPATEGAQPFRRPLEIDQRLSGDLGTDAGTLVAIDSGPTVHVLDGNTGAVRRSAVPTEYPSTVTAFNGLAFVLLDRSRSVVAYDLATLTEKWRKTVPGSGRARLAQCGAESLCVFTGSAESGGGMVVLNTVTGFTGGGDPQTFGAVTRLGNRTLGTDSLRTAFVANVDPWQVTPLNHDGADVRTLAAHGGTALMFINGESPWPDSRDGYHLFFVDLDRRRMSEPVPVGAVPPRTGYIAGDTALVLTHDGRILVLRNPFGS